jgi:hypothetical protein
VVGLCTLNELDPQLESAWFQVISYQVISWFQSLPFKFNLHRYAVVPAEELPAGTPYKPPESS